MAESQKLKPQAPSQLGQPRIGLVTDSNLNRHILKSLLADNGYQLVQSLSTSSLKNYFSASDGVDESDLDAWLLDLEEQCIPQQALDLLVEHSDLPLLVNDNIPVEQQVTEHQIWQRRLLQKLEVVAIAGAGKPLINNQQAATETVWVLVASLGGPEAVSRFLKKLPKGLALTMVYGQHIETNFDTVLTTAFDTDNHYPLQLIRGDHQLTEGQVAVVPADHQLRFLTGGRVVETRQSWRGQYQPVLDQVIADLARVYRQRLGVIVFSGTCNDGEVGCRAAKACGATVWAQSPESCLSPTMPQAAISTGCVTQQGTPEQLAEALVKHLQMQSNSKPTPDVQAKIKEKQSKESLKLVENYSQRKE